MSPSSIAPDNPHQPTVRETSSDAERFHAFTVQWARSQSSVRAYLASFFSDHSLLDDCVQEVALLAWKKAPVDAGGSAFLGHTLATARFIALRVIRNKQSNRLEGFSPDVAMALADTVGEQGQAEYEETQQRLAALRHCLDKLEPEPRALLEARYFKDGHEHLRAEASRLGKSIDALYKKLERLRDLLRTCVSTQLNHVE